MAAPREWQIGTNQVHFEPPDVLVFHLVRAMSPSDAQELIRRIFEAGDAHGLLFLLVLVGPDYTSSPGARTLYGKVDRKYPIRYMAMVGANLGVQVIANMILRAARLITPGRLEFPIEFIASEEVARARVAVLRNET